MRRFKMHSLNCSKKFRIVGNLNKETGMLQDDKIETLYKVLVNEEEQYSFWPTFKDIPLGWRETGKIGTKEECSAYVKEVWLDMRPLSLRTKMEKDKNLN
jgi:MbtH protein